MKITNTYGIPKTIEDVICRDIRESQKPESNYLSVTTIIQPPKVTQLTRRHWDEIDEDISDRLWAMLGTAVHAILDKAEGVGRQLEQILKHKVGDWAISGMSDLYESDTATLSDYKLTSVWSVVLEDGAKIEWEQQLNLYAYLWRITRKAEVKKLQIVAILRDWQKSKALQDKDYPQIQVVVIPVRLWTEQQQKDYLEERLRLHGEAKKLKDDDIPVCTREERWAKPNTYAVMKKGMKKAMRVLPKREEAEAYVLEALKVNPKQTLDITERAGGDNKCQQYCSVNKFCNYYKETYGTKEGDDDTR